MSFLNTGGTYNPITNATSTTNAPSARAPGPAVWSGSEMAVWGGLTDTGYVNAGGRYCAAAPGQTPTPTPSPSPTATATPTPTATAIPTSTPRPTPTARPRPTPAPRP